MNFANPKFRCTLVARIDWNRHWPLNKIPINCWKLCGLQPPLLSWKKVAKEWTSVVPNGAAPQPRPSTAPQQPPIAPGAKRQAAWAKIAPRKLTKAPRPRPPVEQPPVEQIDLEAPLEFPHHNNHDVPAEPDEQIEQGAQDAPEDDNHGHDDDADVDDQIEKGAPQQMWDGHQEMWGRDDLGKWTTRDGREEGQYPWWLDKKGRRKPCSHFLRRGNLTHPLKPIWTILTCMTISQHCFFIRGRIFPRTLAIC